MRAVGSIVFARQNSKIYVLSAQRTHTHKWERTIMLGAAGIIKPKEKNREALEREIAEELDLQKDEITKIIRIGKQNAKIPKSLGFSGAFYLVEVAFETLKKLAFAINKNPRMFPEHRNARINRIKTLGKNPKLLQPHYRKMMPKIKQALIRQKTIKA